MRSLRPKRGYATETLCAALFVSACVSQVPIGEGLEETPSVGAAGRGSGGGGGGIARNCGAEAARGGYIKGGTAWDGSAGNAYGYPPGYRPEQECSGFGFHDTCDFWELCDIACSASSECPTFETSAAPECRSLGASPAQCVQPCRDGSPCPSGMECVNHIYGFGQICMWKKIYG